MKYEFKSTEPSVDEARARMMTQFIAQETGRQVW